MCPVDKALHHGEGVDPDVLSHAFKHLGLAPHGYFGVGELAQVVEVGGAVGGVAGRGPRRASSRSGRGAYVRRGYSAHTFD